MGCKNIYSQYRSNRLRRIVRISRSNSNQSSNTVNANEPPVYNMLDYESYRHTDPVIDYETAKNEFKSNELPSYDQVVISLKNKTAKFKK